jgi:hypothetical protein
MIDICHMLITFVAIYGLYEWDSLSFEEKAAIICIVALLLITFTSYFFRVT